MRWLLTKVPNIAIWLRNFWYFGKLVAELRWCVMRGGHNRMFDQHFSVTYFPWEQSRDELSTGGVSVFSFIQSFSHFVEIHSYSVSEWWTRCNKPLFNKHLIIAELLPSNKTLISCWHLHTCIRFPFINQSKTKLIQDKQKYVNM